MSLVATVTLGLAVTAAGVAGLAMSRARQPPVVPAAARIPAPAGVAAAIPWPSAGGRVAPPAELTIPAIGVRTRLIQLGITAAGALQVPRTTAVAGGYDRSPRPGAAGAAVIAGHIDSLSGPGIFYRLGRMRPGELIYVGRTDGSLAVFAVTAVRTYLKTRFPTEAVYGPAAGVQLRLVSCGGTFDPALGSYLSNIVVYAVATVPRPPSHRAPPRRRAGGKLPRT